MPGGGVAAKRLGIMNGPRVGAAEHGPLHAAMLVAQADFQMVYRLAVALEAEVARLDDARMDRAHGHFVDLVAGHVEEFGRWRLPMASAFAGA